MGFQYWYEGIVFVVSFGIVILVPCAFIAHIGTKMLNDVGNFPTRAAKIQTSATLKVLIVECVTFALLYAFFKYFVSQ